MLFLFAVFALGVIVGFLIGFFWTASQIVPWR